MPKETVQSEDDYKVVVGWSAHGMQVGVQAVDGKTFKFLEDGSSEAPLDSLWFTFHTAAEVTEFQSYIRKAKRKAFPSV